MTRYRIFEEIRESETGEYSAYGVAAFNCAGELITVVPDITVSKNKAEAFAKLCERLGLSPCHLKDVAEDYIISDGY